MPSVDFLVAMFCILLNCKSRRIRSIEIQAGNGPVDFNIWHVTFFGYAMRDEDQIFSHKTVKHPIIHATNFDSPLEDTISQQIGVWPSKLAPKLPKQVERIQTFVERPDVLLLEIGEPV